MTKNAMQLFDEVHNEYGEPHFTTPRNPVGTLNEAFWAALYRSEHDIIFEPRENRFYEYDGGIYCPVTVHAILDRIAKRLRQVATSSPYPFLYRLTLARHINGVIAHLRGQAQKEEAFANYSRLIHVANGVLDLNNGGIALRSFSPELVSRNLIPIEYKANARCRRFKTELLGLLDPDDRELLQKFLGLFLLGMNIIQKMIILHGIGETGKSTFAGVTRKFIGVSNCSELRTSYLADRFEIGSYVGKNLLVGADVPEHFLRTRGANRLKALVGGDLLDAEHKGVNLRFKLEGNFNVLVTSNSRLRAYLENDRGPWARRLAIIEYEKPRTCKIIPYFDDLLIREEGSGILLFAIEGLLKLYDDIEKYGTLQLTETQRARVASLLDESDGLRLFLQENVIRSDSGSSLTTASIVKAFAGFCSERGWNMSLKETERELPELMLELFQVLKSNSIPGPDGKAARGYRGVAFKEPIL